MNPRGYVRSSTEPRGTRGKSFKVICGAEGEKATCMAYVDVSTRDNRKEFFRSCQNWGIAITGKVYSPELSGEATEIVSKLLKQHCPQTVAVWQILHTNDKGMPTLVAVQLHGSAYALQSITAKDYVVEQHDVVTSCRVPAAFGPGPIPHFGPNLIIRENGNKTVLPPERSPVAKLADCQLEERVERPR